MPKIKKAQFVPLFPPYVSLIERIWFFMSRSFNLLVFLFLLLPILVIIPLSFSDSTFLVYPIPGVSMRWYQNLFNSPEWINSAKNSFIVAPLATLLATILGTMAAVGLNKADFRGKSLLMAVLISPASSINRCQISSEIEPPPQASSEPLVTFDRRCLARARPSLAVEALNCARNRRIRSHAYKHDKLVAVVRKGRMMMILTGAVK